MKKIFFLSTLIVVALSSIFITGCSTTTSECNLTVINESGEGIKEMGVSAEDGSSGSVRADNSLIEPGEEFALSMDSNVFTVMMVDSNNQKYTSEPFKVDVKNSSNIVYTVVIEKDSDDNFTFTLKE